MYLVDAESQSASFQAGQEFDGFDLHEEAPPKPKRFWRPSTPSRDESQPPPVKSASAPPEPDAGGHSIIEIGNNGDCHADSHADSIPANSGDSREAADEVNSRRQALSHSRSQGLSVDLDGSVVEDDEEFEGDDTFLAQLQRLDHMGKLKDLTASQPSVRPQSTQHLFPQR